MRSEGWGHAGRVQPAGGASGAALACLHGLGVLWSEQLLVEAVERWRLPLPVLQWLWGQGARISGQQLGEARRRVAGERSGRRDMKVVEWLEQ